MESQPNIMSALKKAVYDQMQLAEDKGLSWTRYGRLAAYCCSLYALVCFVTALSLNRIIVMAAPRSLQQRAGHPHQLESSPPLFGREVSAKIARWFPVFLRVSLIGLLLLNIQRILVALNVVEKIGTPQGQDWWFLKLAGSTIFAYDPAAYAGNQFMATPDTKVMVGPSSDIYWPIFLNLCLLLLVETYVSVSAGKKPCSGTLITLFELSIAFHTDDYGIGMFRLYQPMAPTEQLLMLAMFLSLSCLNVHVGALYNGNRTRLVPLSLISLLCLAYFVARVPFFNILWLSFLPQVIIVGVLLVSLVIFAVAVVGTGFRWRTLNYSAFLFPENMDNEATLTLAGLSLAEDFTVGILKVAKVALILAGKLSYVSEIGGVRAGTETWIERSLWLNFGTHLSALNHRSVLDIVRLLEHGALGYGNVIDNPSESWMLDVGVSAPVSESAKTTSLFRKRYGDMSELLNWLSQLAYGLVVDLLIQPFFRRILGREFNESKLPKFLESSVNEDETSGTDDGVVDPDAYSAEELMEFLDRQWTENDTSADYVGDDESELESEIDASDAGQLGDIMDAELIVDLTDPDFASLFRLALHSDGITTRSRFRQQQQQADDGTKLIELFMERRDKRQRQNTVNNDEDDIPYPCVVCQTNPREYISWPCRCFSVCGSCRGSLATKGMGGCVCCRRHVDGVTKVYIP